MPTNAEQRTDHGALAQVTLPDSSNTTILSGTTKGVHFGGVPSDKVRGVDFNAINSAERPRTALVEHLTANLHICSPSMHAAKEEHIQSILLAVLNMCQDIAAQGLKPGMDEELGHFLPIGAYHLGVLLPDDQVDIVYVTPLHMTLPGTLAILHEKLESMESEVEDMCLAGHDGLLAAPGLQFKLRGIHIKLLLSHCIPDLPPPHGETVRWSTAGVLAHEVSEKLLASVPDVAMYRQLLKFARHWAKQRGVYGSYFGFMGGTAWAICAARICQMYPHADLAQLASRFFKVLSRWDWQKPLCLLPDDVSGQHTSTVLASDGSLSDVTISVFLPVGHSVPATPYVTGTTTKILQKELQHGFRRTQQVELARAQWEHVYSTARFFHRYRHYLELDFMAASPAVFSSWLSWGRQQIQNLVPLFESTSSKYVTLRPWPEWLDFKHAEWPHACAIFVGVHVDRNGDTQSETGKRSLDLREPTVKFLEAANSWPEAEKNADQYELLIRHVRLAELNQWMENRKNGVEARSNISRRGVKEIAETVFQ